MDKQTFSSYGSIVCVVLVIAIMIAFATPFSSYIADGVKDSLSSFKDRTDTILGIGSGSNPGTGGNDSTRLEGDGSEFYTLAPTPLTFLSPAPSDTFKELKVNGETVDPSNYTLTEGSTTSVTLSIDYLKTLEKDTYEVTIVSEGTTATGEFKVEAPELNGHGFYYNQPYVGDVPAFGGKTAFFYREDGTADTILLANNYIETVTYTCSGNTIVATTSMGTMNCTVSADGTEVYVTEIASSFKLGDTSIAADDDYIYIYKEDLGGYEVTAIDRTKASYGAIKTGINGYDTVKLADYAFYLAYYMTVAPHIPDSVTSIGKDTFDSCRFTSIKIPASVTSIDEHAFSTCGFLTNIYYLGTTAQWNAITKGDGWCYSVNSNGNSCFTVHCSDGTLVCNGYGEIIESN